MTFTEVKAQIKKESLNRINSSTELTAMFTEKFNENSNSTLLDLGGILDTICEEIESDHDEDDWGDYPTLTPNQLSDIILNTI